jgi:hypothetical protein
VPATHSRGILFLKNDYWVMRDRVASNGEHNLEFRFHFAADTAPELGPEKGAQVPIVRNNERPGLQLFAASETGSWSKENGSISHCYGSKTAAPVCVFSARSKGSTELLTLLLPLSPGTPQFEVREVEAIGGRAIEITGEHYRDFIMLRDEQRNVIETVRVVSDFKWTWARFSRANEQIAETLMELVVMGGQHLQVDGRETLKSTRPIEYVVATRVGDRFRLETPEGAVDLSLPVHDLDSLFAGSHERMEVRN